MYRLSSVKAAMLPAESRIRVRHAGRALAPEMARRAQAEAARSPRYEWLGELAPWRARALIGRSHVLSLTSEMEVASAHVMIGRGIDPHGVLDQARVLLLEHEIAHATIQVEPDDHAGCAEINW